MALSRSGLAALKTCSLTLSESCRFEAASDHSMTDFPVTAPYLVLVKCMVH